MRLPAAIICVLGASCVVVTGLDEFRTDGLGGGSSATGGEGGNGGAGGDGGSAPSCDDDVELAPAWSRHFGNDANTRATAVVVDAAGNVYVAGFTNAPIDLGLGELPEPENIDFFLAKLGPGGTTLWNKRSLGNNDELIHDLVLSPNGDLIAVGRFLGPMDYDGSAITATDRNDAFVLAVDSDNGDVTWLRHFQGGNHEIANGVGVDAAGNIYAVGQFEGDIDILGEGYTTDDTPDIWVASLDADGGLRWSRQFGELVWPQLGHHIAVDVDGNVYISGTFVDAFDIGSTALDDRGEQDVFVAKLDSNGDALWARPLSGTDEERAFGLALDSSGNLFVAGHFEVDIDIGDTTYSEGPTAFLAKLTPSSELLWSGEYPGADLHSNMKSMVTLDGCDRIVFVGSQDDTIDLSGEMLPLAGVSHDAFVAVLGNEDGSYKWGGSWGGSGDNTVVDVAAEGQNLYVVGVFEGDLTLAEQHLGLGSAEMFVMKLSRPE